MLTVSKEHIEIVQGAGGPKARIVGSRIRVVDIYSYHVELSWSPHEIVEQLPTITVADVYAAMAYYYDHQEELDAKMEEDDRYDEEMRRLAGPSLLEQKLKERERQLIATRP